MKILDLFCGAGGAAMGLHRVWPHAHITGVDIRPQFNYPFCGIETHCQKHPQGGTFTFLQADAMTFPLYGYDFIWASPPCQRYTQMLNHGLTDRNSHPDYIAGIRQRLQRSGVPYVIENVPHAPLQNPITLCGEMFGLRVTRHRLFESNLKLAQPVHKPHLGTHIRKQGDNGYYYRVYGHETGKASWGAAMGIEWMRSPELAQAVPPAYSEWIARHVGDQLEQKASTTTTWIPAPSSTKDATDDDSRTFCPTCEASLTTTDTEAGECTNCRAKLE